MKNITKSVAREILSLIDEHGLVAGLGQPRPGEMCIMAVFNYALGRPHRDDGLEDCVDEDVRRFDIALNDSEWSSPTARAKGMRREAIAKIGSNTLKKGEFSKLLALRAMQKLLPTELRDYAQYCKPEYVEKLKNIAQECESVQNDKEVLARLDSFASLARLDSFASLARLASLDSLDSFDSLDRLDRLASLDRLARLDSLASLASLDSLDSLDRFLGQLSELAVQVLIELKSPGCKWLNLCKEVA